MGREVLTIWGYAKLTPNQRLELYHRDPGALDLVKWSLGINFLRSLRGEL